MSEWTSADAAGLTAGSRIAGYRLEQQVGRGATGAVFQARDEQHGQPVALKIIGPPLAADQAFAGRLLREAPAAASIGEPHILPVLQAGEADGKLFVAMPYIHGGNARALVLREGALSPQRAVPIVWRAGSALDAAHAAGLVHGDVKAANVFVESRPGQPDLVYLSDFGQGRVPAPVLAGTDQASEALDCIAPEQADGKQADGRSDQYALACVAFELLTGVPASRPDGPPRATSLRPGLPPTVDRVLGRALAQAAAYRYGSCREFADALHGAFWPESSPGAPAALAPVAEAPAGGMPDAAPAALAPAAGPVPGVAPAALAPAAGAVPDAVPVAVGPAAAPVPGVAPVAVAPGAGPVADAVPAAYDGPFLSSAGPAPPGASVPAASLPGPEPWLVRGKRRRVRFPVRPVAFIGAAIVAVAGLVGGLVVAMGGGGTPKPTALHIAAQSGNKPEAGYIWTIYGSGNLSRAQIHGDIAGAVSGELARLYAQPFPYNRRPAPLGSAASLHPSAKGATVGYSFQVTPSLATRYHVEIFQSSTATSPLTSSATTTVYVTSAFSLVSTGAPCGRPVCHKTVTGDVLVPPAALSTEVSKPVYAYFGLNLGAPGIPPQPATLQLGAGEAHVLTKPVSVSEYQEIFTFTFTIGKKDNYAWVWNSCTKGTEAQDGIGLPGQHGCGDATVPNQANYLG